MFNGKKIKMLEKRVKELEQVLFCTKRFMEQYFKEKKETFVFDCLFTMDSPIEDIYCFMKSIDKRIEKLEKKKIVKEKVKNNHK